jgi:hypothetical protein
MTNTVLEDFILSLSNSLKEGDFIKLALHQYTGPEPDLKSVFVKRTVIKREEKLSFTFRYGKRDVVKNYFPADGVDLVDELLQTGFHIATLMTTGFDLALQNQKIKKLPPSLTEHPSLEHDRKKQRLIQPNGQTYLHLLGITDHSGKVIQSSQDKYKQINHYIEILSALLKEIPQNRIHKIVDMGAGKGYLTFALTDYLKTSLNMTPDVIGVDGRQDMVDLGNSVARSSHLENLSFTEGSIQDFDSHGTNILIALHACDTATDDAIYKGITAGADLIVVAPCCHKQIRKNMEKNGIPSQFDFLLQHGIFLEREAEMLTDSLRALLLEYCGYKTKIFEFVSGIHTAKNIMIVGIKSPKPSNNKTALLKKIEEAKSLFGIKTHYLESLLKTLP